MIVALIALTALLALGGLTVLSVQGASSATAHDRFTAIARYAAESGIAAGMEYLRDNAAPAPDNWSALVTPANADAVPAPEILGNGVASGETGNVLSERMRSWYEVTILNNDTDPGFAAGEDTDGRVVLHARGHGPNGATTVVEVEVELPGAAAAAAVPCPGYAQKNITEHGAGFNPCLGTIDATRQVAIRPGDAP